MKRKYIFLISLVFLILSWGTNSYSFEYQNADVKLYNKAKNEFLKQNWHKAIESFQKLIDEFPHSSYQDDAHFWLGYCLEKKAGNEMEAFLALDKL
jgi:TolA-binding protein